MNAAEIARIGVLGSGTMGAGIAQLTAAAGIATVLQDADPSALDRGRRAVAAGMRKGVARQRWTEQEADAALALLSTTTEPGEAASGELVIEAVPEQLELKRKVLSAAAEAGRCDLLLATNTSSLSVTEIGGGLPDPSRLVGMHFFNPPPLLPLVEVIAGSRTDPALVATALDLARRIGQQPVEASDTVGFLANRLARPYTLEALQALESGEAGVEEIDEACRDRGGFRMGPFELIDLVGVDVNFAVALTFWERSFHEPRWRPSPLQKRMVDAGLLGRKSGRGFYDYAAEREGCEGGGAERPPPLADLARGSPGERALATILAQLVNEAHFAVAAGIGDRESADLAMRAGFNWPRGPFELETLLGSEAVLAQLDRRWERSRQERYRAAPSLRDAAANAG